MGTTTTWQVENHQYEQFIKELNNAGFLITDEKHGDFRTTLSVRLRIIAQKGGSVKFQIEQEEAIVQNIYDNLK